MAHLSGPAQPHPSPDGIRVTPDELRAMRGEAAALGMPPPGIVASLFPGAFRARYHGRGLEFAEARQYQPGDDFRSLDWRVTARTGRLHTKLFREEREQCLMLLLDAAPGMQFGTRTCFKWVAAARLGALFAWLAVDQGNRLGGLLSGVTAPSPPLRPASGEGAALRLFQQWSTVSPERSAAADAATDLRRLRQLLPPGSLVLLLSDFSAIDARWEAELALLARHHEVAAIRIYDPLEAALPRDGRLPFTDGERLLQIDSADPALRRRYREQFRRQEARLSDLLRRHGGTAMAIGNHEQPAESLRRQLPRRSRPWPAR